MPKKKSALSGLAGLRQTKKRPSTRATRAAGPSGKAAKALASMGGKSKKSVPTARFPDVKPTRKTSKKKTALKGGIVRKNPYGKAPTKSQRKEMAALDKMGESVVAGIKGTKKPARKMARKKSSQSWGTGEAALKKYRKVGKTIKKSKMDDYWSRM